MQGIRRFVTLGQHVVDVGANVGFYSVFLAGLVGPSGCVYSFEPVSQNFNILDEVIKRKRLTNVKAFFAAVDRVPGEQNMVIPDRADFTGFYQARLASVEDAGKKQRVRVVSLDQFWTEAILPSVDFIKCDAEGSELGILQGAAQLLKKSHPTLFLEVQRKTGAEVFNLLHSFGYQAFVFKGEFREVRQFDPSVWNYFFVKHFPTLPEF
jgi:FkbM family methyltransferase